MGLPKRKFFVVSYKPLILCYAAGCETRLDLELLRRGGEKVVMLQFLSWWAGDESSMQHYLDYQKFLERQGIEHHLMVNAPDEDELRVKMGIRGTLCSKNLFADERVFDLHETDRTFDAVYVAQLHSFKRHQLARDVKKLIVYSYGGDLPAFCPEVSHAVHSGVMLPPEYVAAGIQHSHCGLCLSDIEGQMNAAIEYLLCGRPVVTTPSRGGRDLYFNDSNSLTVPPIASDVANGVAHWKKSGVNPLVIRAQALDAVNYWRRILSSYAVDLIHNDAESAKVSPAALQERLFNGKHGVNFRMVLHAKIHERKSMAPFATENYALKAVLNPDIRICESGDGSLVVENEDRELLGFNDVSAAVLNACYKSMTVSDILTLFRASYPDASARLEEDVVVILQKLFESKIIDVVVPAQH